MNAFTIALIAVGAMSLLTLCLYGADKGKARRGAWRISERTLLLCSFFGGAPGGFSAMLLFRHKTKHRYFTAINLLGLLWQIALCVFLFFKTR